MKTCLIVIACVLFGATHLFADAIPADTTAQPQTLPLAINYSEKFDGPANTQFGLEYLYHIEITDPEGFGNTYLNPMYESITFNGISRSFDGTWEFPGQDSLCIDSLVKQAFQESLLLLLVSIQGEVYAWTTTNFPCGIDPYALNEIMTFAQQGFFETRYAKITLSVSTFQKPAYVIKTRDVTRR